MQSPSRPKSSPPASFVAGLADVRERLDLIEARLETLSVSVEELVVVVEDELDRRNRRLAS